MRTLFSSGRSSTCTRRCRPRNSEISTSRWGVHARGRHRSTLFSSCCCCCCGVVLFLVRLLLSLKESLTEPRSPLGALVQLVPQLRYLLRSVFGVWGSVAKSRVTSHEFYRHAKQFVRSFTLRLSKCVCFSPGLSRSRSPRSPSPPPHRFFYVCTICRVHHVLVAVPKRRSFF